MTKVMAYFAPVEPGGLADYAVCQVRALTESGCQIVFLGYPFIKRRVANVASSIQFIELELPPKTGSRFKRLFTRIGASRRNVKTLVGLVEELRITTVLISAYTEYFAPFWAKPLARLAKKSVKFGVVVHDPVRDFVLGPKWWHLYSISQAYSFVYTAFVHEAGEVDTGWPRRRNLRQAVIPHGPYEFPTPENPFSRAQIRQDMHILADAKVLLSFGHIRDGKNLDSVIRALAQLPDFHLVVAGTEQSSGQKSASWYRELADELGVSARCHWHVRFISDEEVYQFFTAADLVVLLYSSDFRSASGVLNASSQFGLPVIASSGEGPLKTLVNSHQLGRWIEPGDWDQLPLALKSLFEDRPTPDWDKYQIENSWEQNALNVLKHLVNSTESTG
jgi:glycosyltransferase involved in cell wall biosynthesis